MLTCSEIALLMNTPPNNIKLIDVQHLGRPHVVASYLLLGEEPALVDPGPTSALPGLEAGLASHGLEVGDLRVLLLTHIHLDHAGATGTLVQRNPRLRVYVHERGAPHMIDPEKLLRSATRLYGENMGRLWGEFLPTPAEHVVALRGGEQLDVGQRMLHAYDAPGHASHHLLYHEAASGALWCGDNAGIRMPGYSYLRPATPPPDVDLVGWERTWQLMESLAPRQLLLTHFGVYDDALRHIADLRARTAAWSAIVRQGLASGLDDAAQSAMLQQYAEQELIEHAGSAERTVYSQAASVDQCWQGLARYWRKI
jgi:glyoxylase-like metal-dependent hydrolase (beta-lactamase superfamily II)